MGTSSRRSILLAQSWWQDRVLRGVADFASTHNWELNCRMRWTHRLPDVETWSGDGIIAWVGVSEQMRQASEPIVEFVREAKVPVVTTQAFADLFNAPRVHSDHAGIGALAADYFLGLNFRYFGYVTFLEYPTEACLRGAFQERVEANGGKFFALTFNELEKVAAELPKPMALFALNDPNALDVIMKCQDAGYRIPEEFAVMGVENTEIICDLSTVPLSSISCNFARVGYEAAALLDRLIDGEEPPDAPIVIPPRGITVRESTDTIAIPHLDTARLLRYLRTHYQEPLTIQEAADRLEMSIRKVNDTFRRHVGWTPHHELTRLRVAHAKKLMADPTMKLEAIALESGFSSRFHLIQTFHRVEGISPKNYRKQLVAANNA